MLKVALVTIQSCRHPSTVYTLTLLTLSCADLHWLSTCSRVVSSCLEMSGALITSQLMLKAVDKVRHSCVVVSATFVHRNHFYTVENLTKFMG